MEVKKIYGLMGTRGGGTGRIVFRDVKVPADAIMDLDAALGLIYLAAKMADSGQDARRLVSEAKRFSTEMAWRVVNHAMQILGGIGYTQVFPVERLLMDIRLIMIWTGTSEIMNLIIQHEYYKEILRGRENERFIEQDAADYDEEEIVYE